MAGFTCIMRALGRPEPPQTVRRDDDAALRSDETTPVAPLPPQLSARHLAVPRVEETDRPKRHFKTVYRDEDGKRHRTSIGADRVLSRAECLERARNGKLRCAYAESKALNAQLVKLSEKVAAKSTVRIPALTGALRKLEKAVTSKTQEAAARGVEHALSTESCKGKLTPSHHLAMACSGEFTTTSKARRFDCDEHTVRRSQSAAAHAAMLALEVLLISTLCQLREAPPVWAVCNQAWDETAHTLIVYVGKEPIRSTWQIMVYCATFAWMLADGSTHYLPCTLPPLPLPNNQAPSMWQAMTGHDFLRPIMTFRAGLMTLAHRGVSINTLDCASSNTKLVAHELAEDTSAWQDTCPCFSHQTCIAFKNVWFSIFGHALLNNLFAVTMFFANGEPFIAVRTGCPRIR